MLSILHTMRSCFQSFGSCPVHCIPCSVRDQSECPANYRGRNSGGKTEERLLIAVWALAAHLTEELLLLLPLSHLFPLLTSVLYCPSTAVVQLFASPHRAIFNPFQFPELASTSIPQAVALVLGRGSQLLCSFLSGSYSPCGNHCAEGKPFTEHRDWREAPA